MPTKKRSNIARYTRKCKQSKQRRCQENDEQRSERLAADRYRKAQLRASLTPTQRETLLASERERQAKTRKRQNEQLNADRRRRMLSRVSETSEHASLLPVNRKHRALSLKSEIFTQNDLLRPIRTVKFCPVDQKPFIHHSGLGRTFAEVGEEAGSSGRLANAFDDGSEPIYTNPSLFERSRSLRSLHSMDLKLERRDHRT